MKLQLLTAIMMLNMMVTAQALKWNQINNQSKNEVGFRMNGENDEEIVVTFTANELGSMEITTPNGVERIFRLKHGAQIQQKGNPDLDRITQSVMIHPTATTHITVVSSEYTEYSNVAVAPSKGVLSRDKNPAKVPFEYGDAYKENKFFPGELATLGMPYNIRETRGQAIELYPLQYNPVTQTLRVYTQITVKISYEKAIGINPVFNINSDVEANSPFERIISNHYLNYPETRAVLPETGGKMLIICYDNFTSTMQAFVDWKTSIGMQVQMVNYSTIGSASALKTYVANYYNTNGLTYLLLVGDNAQVPTSSTTAGDSDNNYGYIVGNDHYLDIFVGRFSAENTTDLATMVNRTIYYERDMASNNALITKGIGIASNEGTGGGGDNNESDEQHMNNIEADLQGYGYTITRCYQNGGSTSQLSTLINNGAGIINYVGHGSNTSWAAPSFTNTNVSALTNTNKFPFIISVACVVGNFKSITCFAESWIRASYNGTPTGGLVFCGSTINQSWASPMRAQDQINDLLVANTYKTYGGLFVNGMFAMIDAYGTDGNNMADTWTVFGDPSVQTRTPGHPNGPQSQSTCGTPANLAVSNISTSGATLSWGSVTGATSYTVAYKASSASTWTEATQTQTTKVLTGLSEATTYEFKVKSTCSEGTSAYSASTSFTTNGTPVTQYCTSSGNDFSYEWISKVQFGSYTKSSAGTAYSDYTAEQITMSAGGTVSVTLTPAFKSSTYTEHWGVFIDYNGDKDFDDAGETVFTGSGTSAVSGSFNVAASASGQTRMRVVMHYNSAAAACGSYDYGETEDYTIVFGGTPPVEYCAASGSNYSYEWIAGVQVGSFNKTSGAAGYTDNTASVISVNAGGSYAVTLTPGFKSSTYMEYWKIWADFNGNGSFDDSGELLYSGNGSAALSGTIAIPSTASGTTRLRVAMKYNAAPTSCGSFSYGEVEDYTITVNRALSIENKNEGALALAVGPNPNNGQFYLYMSGTAGKAEIRLISITGQEVYRNEVEKPEGEMTFGISGQNITSGIYMVKVTIDGQNFMQKIIVQ